MSQQQTVLRVLSNIPNPNLSAANQYFNLDLYSSVPIKINKSFSELQDITKKNSDYSIGLLLPGTKMNNKFFETYYNVDAVSLYFNANARTNCQVLLNEETYFTGYMRLNKVSVMNSKVEYDVTLFSTIGDLFGQIGNNLLKDLDFADTEYTFNHQFTFTGVTNNIQRSNFFIDGEKPIAYFYPVVHNGYNYVTISGTTLPNVSGTPITDVTRLYTSTSPIGYWSTISGATAAGVQEYYINSPQNVLLDNQLKPALNVWSLLKLIFKTYGYEIEGDLFNTPWMKTLYLYGYFSSELTKFSWKLNSIQTLPLDGVELIYDPSTNSAVVTKAGTGIPCYCLNDINVIIYYNYGATSFSGTIVGGATGITSNVFGTYDSMTASVPIGYGLRYSPVPVGTTFTYQDGDNVDFSLVIDTNIKQIDIISSIAKKFNLVFIPNKEFPNKILVEPYDFYVGTGNIYDWTPNLSYDKGFSVEPALNYVESQLNLTDLEDNDEGNRIFKIQNNRIYGQNYVYNPTDFKSQEKKLETIFSSELVRKWDDNIGLPLGINYSAASEISSSDQQVRWTYKGIKTKPKLFFWLKGNNPFIDNVNEVFDYGLSGFNTYTAKLQNSAGGGLSSFNELPTICHTMPIGLADEYKINNDSLSILFNSELPVDFGVQTYNVYTENDAYLKFYQTRITNIYNQNTRFLKGYFNLLYSDIKNLEPNDIIKINEQYFTINKISEFNLTNRELTQVELLQFNNNPQKYTDRYFAYYYCNAPSTCYKFKTDFTNPNLLDTNYIWSLYYDNQVGSLSGTTSGFTSSFRIFNPGDFTIKYYPYTMYEITEDEYLNGTCLSWDTDAIINYVYSNPNGLQYSLASFWVNNASTKTGINVFEDCDMFNAYASTYGISTGSTVPIVTPTVTPTPTSTPTPTPTPTVNVLCNIDGLFYQDNTPTPSPTPTITPTPTPTATPTPTPTITPTPFPNNDDGKYVYYRGYTFTSPVVMNISSNYGSTFSYSGSTPIDPFNDSFFAVTSLGDTLYLGHNNNIYKSTNSGITFTYLSSIPTGSSITSIDCDYSGQYVSVGTDGTKYYKSDDYGATWTLRNTGSSTDIINVTVDYQTGYPQYFTSHNGSSYNPNLLKIDSSNNLTTAYTFSYGIVYFTQSVRGNIKIAVLKNNSTGGTIGYLETHISRDYGVTWTDITSELGMMDVSNVTTLTEMQGIGVSDDGRYITVPNHFLNRVYYSHDFGYTFDYYDFDIHFPSSGFGYPQSVSISASGKYQYALTGDASSGFRNTIYSNDYGLTWQVSTPYVSGNQFPYAPIKTNRNIYL